MKVSTTPALLDSLPQQIFTEFNQLFTSLFSQVTSQQCSFDQAEPEIIQGVMKIARQALAQLLLSYDLEEKHINRPNILGDQWFTYSGKLPRTTSVNIVAIINHLSSRVF